MSTVLKLDWDLLIRFVDRFKPAIYCVYAGLMEDWSHTSDEVYHTDFGWLDDHMACTESTWAHPIAYIHYKEGYKDILSEFRYCITEEKDD